MFYVIDYIGQGTSEWHTWRRGVIGASDAVKVMGENPWESREGLMKEKLGLRAGFSGNAATREGQLLEGPAREALARASGRALRPTIIQDGELPFLAASLDAIDKKNRSVFEIKCGRKAYEKARATRRVPSYYVGQIQHMLMISGQESLTYAAFRPGEPLITMTAYRDDRYIKRLRDTERAFVDELIRRGHEVQRIFLGQQVR